MGRPSGLSICGGPRNVERTIVIIVLSLTVLGVLPAGCASSRDPNAWTLSDCSDPDNAFHCPRSAAWWKR